MAFIIFMFNFLGLLFEIIGFIMMIKSEKQVELRQGGFAGAEFVYSDTRIPVEKTQVLGNHGLFRKGIVFVIVGLTMQMIALFFNSQNFSGVN